MAQQLEGVRLKLARISQKQQGYTNQVYVNPNELAKLGVSKGDVVLINNQICYKIAIDNKLDLGTIGTNVLCWSSLGIAKTEAIGTNVIVSNWKLSNYAKNNRAAGTIKVKLTTYSQAATVRIEKNKLQQAIIQLLDGQILSKNQQFVFKFNLYWFKLEIISLYPFSKNQKYISTDDGDNNGEEELPSYDTIEGNNNDDYKQKEKQEQELQFASMGGKFLRPLVEIEFGDKRLEWKQNKSVKYDIDMNIISEGYNDNSIPIRTARFNFNGQEQKYLLC